MPPPTSTYSGKSSTVQSSGKYADLVNYKLECKRNKLQAGQTINVVPSYGGIGYQYTVAPQQGRDPYYPSLKGAYPYYPTKCLYGDKTTCGYGE